MKQAHFSQRENRQFWRAYTIFMIVLLTLILGIDFALSQGWVK